MWYGSSSFGVRRVGDGEPPSRLQTPTAAEAAEAATVAAVFSAARSAIVLSESRSGNEGGRRSEALPGDKESCGEVVEVPGAPRGVSASRRKSDAMSDTPAHD